MTTVTQLQEAKKRRKQAMKRLFGRSGLSRRKIALRLGVTLSAVQSWASGEIPTLENALKLSQLLSISINALAGAMGFLAPDHKVVTPMERLFNQSKIDKNELANLFGVTPMTVQSWTEGTIPSLENALRLRDVLNVSQQELFDAMGVGVSLDKKYLRHPLGKLIKQSKISREKLAERLGVSVTTVSSWAVGRSIPAFDRVCAMSYLLNVSIEALSKAILASDRQNPNIK